MGVKGLKSFLNGRKNCDGAKLAIPEAIPRGSNLLVDAFGFALQLAERPELTHPELGGQYSEYSLLLRKEIQMLTGLYGLQLTFYFDGRDSKLKSKTYEKRKLRREERWLNLYNMTLDDNKGNMQSGVELPLAALILQVLRSVLLDLKMPIVFCDGEADQVIAKMCNSINLHSPGQIAFCYGDDTDFIAMTDCPYILLGSLKIAENTSVVANHVFRRSSTAAFLGLTEAQFVELCILLGNDFTEGYSRSLFDRVMPALSTGDVDKLPDSTYPVDSDDALSDAADETDEDDVDPSPDIVQGGSIPFPKGNKPASIENILSHLQEAAELSPDGEIRLTSSRSPSLDLAIRYSRALYSLEDLSSFPNDRDDNRNDSEDTEAMLLTRDQKNSVRDWLKEKVFDHKEQFRHSIIEYLKVHSAEMFSDEISHVHIDAIEQMQIQLAAPRKNIAALPKRIRPKWSTVVAANIYQRICREFYRKVSNEAALSESSVEITCSPVELFDGLLFHSLVGKLEKIIEDRTKLASPSKALSSSDEIVTAVVAPGKEALPIDLHKEAILRKISSDRVTIIHGETGCGKSSRLPAILLEDAESRGQHCMMMVCQPRRIAANALMKRLRQTLGEKIGMRMGHGVKDESPEARIIFVTTGYIVRLLAHHPDAFNNHTHLIIDEVHERSVDGDVLCLLARRLLQQNSTIRLILMSATVHTQLYKEYFTKDYNYGDMECLSVGVRRFPVNIKHLEDISSPHVGSALPPMITSLAKRLQVETSRSSGKPTDILPANMLKDQYSLVVALIRAIAVNGTGVLVFVSGITDITEITEKFEGLPRYKLIAIHSDIPFEEQEQAFIPAEPDQVKVIVATNAAESSVTLPDVDLVLCLGTHKALQYNSSSHRAQLVNSWISKASATQRAGRTGRVRPGTVYRLYSQQVADRFQEHDQSEVHRQPLQDVILNLRVMLEESSGFDGVQPILEDLLEPPELANIEKSFGFLHVSGMISAPNDEGMITSVGRLAGSLPVDLSMGRMIAMGISLGVGLEACIMASALSQPKSVFRVASPLIHRDPDEFNAIIKQTITGVDSIDDGVYSEPIMMLKLFIAWQKMSFHARDQWAMKNGLAHSRVKQFISSSIHLVDRVNKALNFRGSVGTRATLNVDSMVGEQESNLSPRVLNSLRLILTWAGDGNIIKMKPLKTATQMQLTAVPFEVSGGARLTIEQLTPILPDPKIVPWSLNVSGKIIYDAKLSPSRLVDDATGHLGVLAQVLVDTGTTHGAVWVLQQPQIIQSSSGDPPSKKDKKRKGKDATETPTQGYFAILILQNDPKSAADTLKKLTAFFGHRLSIISAIEDNPIYALRAPSTKETRLIKVLHDDIPASLSLLIPTEGKAKLTASNVKTISKPQLQSVFFGSDLTNEEAHEDSWESTNNYHIAEQIMNVKQEIVFTNIFDPELSSPSKPASSKASSKAKRQSKGNKEVVVLPIANESTAPHPMIADVSIGVRLLASYMLGYKCKGREELSMKLWKPHSVPPPDTQNAGLGVLSGKIAHKAVTLIPGSKEWREAKGKVDGGESKEAAQTNRPSSAFMDDNDDQKLIVRFKIPRTAWNLLPALSTQNSTIQGSPMALLPRQSLQAVAIHCGTGALFGVAQSTLLVGSSQQQIVRCEGVTFLPPGSRWLSLALLCVGTPAGNQLWSPNNSPFLPIPSPLDHIRNQPVSQAYADLCSEVCDHLNEIQFGDICRNDRLVELLDALFAAWTEELDVFEMIDNMLELESDDFEQHATNPGGMFAAAAMSNYDSSSYYQMDASNKSRSQSKAATKSKRSGRDKEVGNGLSMLEHLVDDEIDRALEELEGFLEPGWETSTLQDALSEDSIDMDILESFAAIELNEAISSAPNVSSRRRVNSTAAAAVVVKRVPRQAAPTVSSIAVTENVPKEVYSCFDPSCGKKFDSEKKAYAHLQTTGHAASTFIRPNGKQMKKGDIIHLLRKQCEENNPDKVAPCELCGKSGFKSNEAYIAHFQAKHGSHPVEAPVAKSAQVTQDPQINAGIIAEAIDILFPGSPYVIYSKQQIEKILWKKFFPKHSLDSRFLTSLFSSTSLIKIEGYPLRYTKIKFVVDKLIVQESVTRILSANRAASFTVSDIIKEITKAYPGLSEDALTSEAKSIKTILKDAVKGGLLQLTGGWYQLPR